MTCPVYSGQGACQLFRWPRIGKKRQWEILRDNIKMGTVAGVNAINLLLELPLLPYRQEFYVTCLDLGGSGAVFTQGWERELVKKGHSGAEIKAQINNQWIYPPSPTIGKTEIFNFIQSKLND